MREFIGEEIRAYTAFPATAMTAGGSGDNTEITGTTYDKLANNFDFLGGRLIFQYLATIASTKTLSFLSIKVEDSADGTNWTQVGSTLTGGVAATGAVTAGVGTYELAITKDLLAGADFRSLRRYVRIKVTPDLSAANTDTATVSGLWVLGSPKNLRV